MRGCAPPDEEFVERLGEAGLSVVATGRPVRPLVTTVAVGLAQRAAELMAAQFETVASEAEGSDVLVATGPLPVTAGARSVAEKLGIRYVHAGHQRVVLPSAYRRPPARRGRPLPDEVTDNRVLWDLDARIANEMFGDMLNAQRAAAGLAPVDDVRDYAFTDRPWPATDPVLDPWQPTDLDVVQTGAWILPDERPLPAGLAEFLDAGAPPVYAGFGSTTTGAAPDIARVAVEAIRAQGPRAVVARGWADLELVDGDDCFVVDEVNHQALFRRVAAVVHHGSGGTTTTAARAGAPQLVVPQGADQPYWAGRVSGLGIGVAHEGPSPSVESLSVALKAALAPEILARATAVAGTVRSDGARVAAKLLLTPRPVRNASHADPRAVGVGV